MVDVKVTRAEAIFPPGKNRSVSFSDESGTLCRNKFAPVAPYHIYRSMCVNGYIPDVVLLLAHDVVEWETEYYQTFADPRWNNTTIIMDNSLVETGGAVNADMVMRAANAVAADIVVLPDVMGKGLDSAQATINAWHEWQWKFREYKKLAVIHGDGPEFFQACEMLVEAGIDPDWISIPRISEKGGLHNCSNVSRYGQSDRLRLIGWSRMFFPQKPIHLLGFSDYIGHDLIAASHPAVVSIDSAVPLRLTSNNIISEDAGKRPKDWFETVSFDLSMIERCKQVDKLINNASNY